MLSTPEETRVGGSTGDIVSSFEKLVCARGVARAGGITKENKVPIEACPWVGIPFLPSAGDHDGNRCRKVKVD